MTSAQRDDPSHFADRTVFCVLKPPAPKPQATIQAPSILGLAVRKSPIAQRTQSTESFRACRPFLLHTGHRYSSTQGGQPLNTDRAIVQINQAKGDAASLDLDAPRDKEREEQQRKPSISSIFTADRKPACALNLHHPPGSQRPTLHLIDRSVPGCPAVLRRPLP